MEERLFIYYDGSRGPALSVPFRNTGRAATFTADKPVKFVPNEVASDLLSPQIGGGAFVRALPLADARERFGRIPKGVELLTYSPAAGGDDVQLVALTKSNLERLAPKKATEPKAEE